jgi:hypothetical protein
MRIVLIPLGILVAAVIGLSVNGARITKAAVSNGPPTTEQKLDAQLVEACADTSNWAATACVRGYQANKGNLDPKSAEFQRAAEVCGRSAEKARDNCLKGEAAAYLGQSKKGFCTDLAMFLADSVHQACEEVTKKPDELATCNRWAVAGAEDFRKFCHERGGDAPTEGTINL